MMFENTKEWMDENPKRPQFQVVTDETNLEEGTEAQGSSDEEDDIPF